VTAVDFAPGMAASYVHATRRLAAGPRRADGRTILAAAGRNIRRGCLISGDLLPRCRPRIQHFGLGLAPAGESSSPPGTASVLPAVARAGGPGGPPFPATPLRATSGTLAIGALLARSRRPLARAGPRHAALRGHHHWKIPTRLRSSPKVQPWHPLETILEALPRTVLAKPQLRSPPRSTSCALIQGAHDRAFPTPPADLATGPPASRACPEGELRYKAILFVHVFGATLLVTARQHDRERGGSRPAGPNCRGASRGLPYLLSDLPGWSGKNNVILDGMTHRMVPRGRCDPHELRTKLV